jgi:IS5 family transposase
LERTDSILRLSGVEKMFATASLAAREANQAKLLEAGEVVLDGPSALQRYLRHTHQALRCTVLKNLLGLSYRTMSKTLAMTPLYQWFCDCGAFDVVQVPSKSTLQSYAHWLGQDDMKKVLDLLTQAMSDEERAREIGLENELDLSVAYVDTTCLKACIHFPVDWVLMRDGVRTLVKSILTIRRHGLLHRISEPTDFLRQINALSMGMSAAKRGKAGAKKERKKTLRAMKKVSQLVQSHGERYRDELDKHWAETDLTRKEAEVSLRRMDNVIGQLPEARRQAHERIVGERQVPSAQKMLSLYEGDVNVIVRGKAGAAVEFGNSLFLAESPVGLIVDHELKSDASEGDAKWLAERMAGLKDVCQDKLIGVVGDRGFESKANRKMLAEAGMFNGLCPRNPHELSERLENDEDFQEAIARRAQTEGRVGILKNVFLGGTPLAKGFKNRELQVSWAVLAHNLWVIARLPWKKPKEEALAA